jgi:hypothetical protein
MSATLAAEADRSSNSWVSHSLTSFSASSAAITLAPKQSTCALLDSTLRSTE